MLRLDRIAADPALFAQAEAERVRQRKLEDFEFFMATWERGMRRPVGIVVATVTSWRDERGIMKAVDMQTPIVACDDGTVWAR